MCLQIISFQKRTILLGDDDAEPEFEHSKLSDLRCTPPPPYPVEAVFNRFIAFNLLIINGLRFHHVNELVTQNPLFCPIFSPESAIFRKNSAIFATIEPLFAL